MSSPTSLAKFPVHSVTAPEFVKESSRDVVEVLKWKEFRSRPYVVFLAGSVSPTSEHIGGYPDRVRQIDRQFRGWDRVYIQLLDTFGGEKIIRTVDDGVHIFYVNSDDLTMAVAEELVKGAQAVYAHSILALASDRARRLFANGQHSILDLHGIVPEESEMNGDLAMACEAETNERAALQLAHSVVCVTTSMFRYIRDKYVGIPAEKFIVIPIMTQSLDRPSVHPRVNAEDRFIYLGGTEKWQCFDLMINAAVKSKISVDIYSTDIHRCKEIISGLPARYEKYLRVYSENDYFLLWSALQESDYGFVLRSSSIVNRVACPTKLVNYLATGVVPVLYADEGIGDFKELGMMALSLEELQSGSLPSKGWKEAAQWNNLVVFAKLKRIHNLGVYKMLSRIQ